ncbi:hypothetical protein ABW19_dt0210156 [Dactylella cylindrospora]|nr:hypothetical protein ABW19_dt0210156 [Dactylella cylindrospora]
MDDNISGISNFLDNFAENRSRRTFTLREDVNNLTFMVTGIEKQAKASNLGSWGAADSLNFIHRSVRGISSNYRAFCESHPVVPENSTNDPLMSEFDSGSEDCLTDYELPPMDDGIPAWSEPTRDPFPEIWPSGTALEDTQAVYPFDIDEETSDIEHTLYTGDGSTTDSQMNTVSTRLAGFCALLELSEPDSMGMGASPDAPPAPDGSASGAETSPRSEPEPFSGTPSLGPHLQGVSSDFFAAVRVLYEKLEHAATLPTASPHFKSFVSSLQSLHRIIYSGIAALERLFSGSRPSTVRDIWCMIHVAFGISQADSKDTPTLPDQMLHDSLSILRSCLASEANYRNNVALLDEILEVAAEEVKLAISWINIRRRDRGAGIYDDLKDSILQPTNKRKRDRGTWVPLNGPGPVPGGVTSRKRRRLYPHDLHLPDHQSFLPTPSASDVQSLGFIQKILGFLEGLELAGGGFLQLSGLFCESVAHGPFRSKIDSRLGLDGSLTHQGYLDDVFLAVFLEKHLFEPLWDSVTRYPAFQTIVTTTYRRFRKGHFVTLRDVEVYMMGLHSMISEPEKDRSFGSWVLHYRSLHCANGLEKMNSKRIKWIDDEAYSEEYVVRRTDASRDLEDYAAIARSTGIGAFMLSPSAISAWMSARTFAPAPQLPVIRTASPAAITSPPLPVSPFSLPPELCHSLSVRKDHFETIPKCSFSISSSISPVSLLSEELESFETPPSVFSPPSIEGFKTPRSDPSSTPRTEISLSPFTEISEATASPDASSDTNNALRLCCRTCNQTFRTRRTLIRHESKHNLTNAGRRKCSYCNFEATGTRVTEKVRRHILEFCRWKPVGMSREDVRRLVN